MKIENKPKIKKVEIVVKRANGDLEIHTEDGTKIIKKRKDK